MPALRTLMTNRFTLLCVSLLVSVLTVTAQRPDNHGLVVTGSVQKVEAKCLEGKQFIAVTLSLQTRNDSPDPIILISGMNIFDLKLNFITTKPGASEETVVAGNLVEYNPYQENPWGPPTVNDFDPDASWVKDPERREAPTPIMPGRYAETRSVIGLTSGFHMSAKATEAFKACKPVKETPIPDYPTFYLEFRMSLKKYDRGDEVMRLLKERWKPVGVLPLDANGDITFRSEPIIFPSTK